MKKSAKVSLDKDLIEATKLLMYFIAKIDGVKDFNPLVYPEMYERSKTLISKVSNRLRQK